MRPAALDQVMLMFIMPLPKSFVGFVGSCYFTACAGCCPVHHPILCDMQALSRVGRCQTFESSADGYGRGEGIAVLLLGSADAQQSGKTGGSMAILQGSAVNQDGRYTAGHSSLYAPQLLHLPSMLSRS